LAARKFLSGGIGSGALVPVLKPWWQSSAGARRYRLHARRERRGAMNVA
jgi:hypothetical protein